MKRSPLVLAVLSVTAMAVALAPATTTAGAVPWDATAVAGSPPAHADGWSRVWLDDFNGPSRIGVNPSVWKYDTGQGIFGTGEIETMTTRATNSPACQVDCCPAPAARRASIPTPR